MKQINITATPFAEVLNNFELIEDDLTGKLEYLREYSSSKQRVWAATTQHSLLSRDDMERPEGMEVRINDVLTNPSDQVPGGSINWRCLKTNRTIDISGSDLYSKQWKCLLMDVDESFSFEVLLPDAPVEFEIVARRNWHPVDLELSINDTLFAEKAVGKKFAAYTFPNKANMGFFKITIEPTLSQKINNKTRSAPPRLLISQITVKTKNDLILFSLPSAEQEEFLKADIRAKYLSGQNKLGEDNEFLSIFRMKHSSLLDPFDQRENPENIKKKITLDNLSLDVLMAPPTSRFDFALTLPPESVLEFGIGIFGEKNPEEPKPVKFKILAEHNKETLVLYEKKLTFKHGRLKNKVVLDKIDLAPFSKKKIHLSLITEWPKNVPADRHIFPFWFNPIIYRPKGNKPNIILISLDTLRADHIGCYGYHRRTSPNMDELAKESVLFQKTYAHSPWTLPSHVSMLYSLNSASHQVYYSTQKIDPSLPSLASLLKSQGYITQAFTGGGFVDSVFGFAKGFDWYEDVPERSPKNEAEMLLATTASWVKENQEKPFFLFLHTFQIHGPYDSPAPWNKAFLSDDAKWEKIGLMNFLESHGKDYPFTQAEIENIVSLYDGEILYTDEMLINPLVSLMKDLGIYDNSLIIITSDHGEEFNDHGGWLHSQTVYEEMLHVPLMIKFPNSRFKGESVKTRCRLIDIMPTILEIASADYDKKSIDGESLMSLISGKESQDRIFISDVAYKNIPVPCPVLIATNRNSQKFIFEKSESGVKDIQVYDLDKDSKEKNNLFRMLRDKIEAVNASLEEYYAKKFEIKRNLDEAQQDERLKEKLKALGYIN
ncbi:MAG: sulfatase [Candidatus Aminicenantes bacterium]|nr:sulfatase [Candidatus Aminicenantes bacterium]